MFPPKHPAKFVVPSSLKNPPTLIDLTKGVTLPHYHIRLTNSVKANLRLWQTFFDEFNGRSFFLGDTWLNSDCLQLESLGTQPRRRRRRQVRARAWKQIRCDTLPSPNPNSVWRRAFGGKIYIFENPKWMLSLMPSFYRLLMV